MAQLLCTSLKSLQHLGRNGTTPAVWVDAAQKFMFSLTEQLSGRSQRLQPRAGATIAIDDNVNCGVDIYSPSCREATCDGFGTEEANTCRHTLADPP